MARLLADENFPLSRLHEGHWLEVGVYGDREKVRAAPFDAVEIDLAEWWGEP
jgi:hypothetical protein